VRVFSFHGIRAAFRGLYGSGVLLGLLISLLVSALPASAQFPAELHGRVVDGFTGQGILGVRISIEGTPHRVLTEGDGSFRIRGLEEGLLRFTVFASGFQPQTREIELRNGRITRELVVMRDRIVELDPVEVAVAPGEGVVLDREAVARSGARSLGELLEGLPGVVVRRRGPGGAAEVSLRGSGSGGVLVLVDGVPVNDPMTGSADLSVVSTAAVRKVEVLQGARGARYGSGALGGVIRVTTGALPPGGELSVFGGSLGEAGGSVTVAGPLGSLDTEWDGRLRRIGGGFAFDRGDFLGGGGDRRNNADLLERGLRFGVAGDAGSGRWRLQGSVDALSRGVPGKVYAPSDSARQTRERASLQGRWRGGLGGVPVELTGHHLRQDVRFRDQAPPLGPPFDARSRLQGTGFDGEVLPLEGVSDRLLLGGGVSLRHHILRSTEFRGDGRVERLDGSVFAHGETTPLPLPGNPGVSAALRLHRDGGTGEWVTAHDLTLRFRLGPFRLHAAHRSSFSPPGAGDQYFREGVGVRPNPDLRGERVPGEVEAGAALAFSRGTLEGHLEGELFRGDLVDMIVWAPDFRFVWSPRNQDVRRSGGELRARLLHRPLALGVGGHLSRTDVTYARDRGGPRVQVIYRPRDTGSLFLTWDPGSLQMELRARYTGLRYPVAAPVNALDPFWSVDAVLSARWSLAGWSVRPLVRVERLLDERDPFIFAFPEPGRTLRLEVRLTPDPRLPIRP
jgi:vitamin B12 transporter